MVLDCIDSTIFALSFTLMVAYAIRSVQSNAPYMDRASSKIYMVPIVPKRDNNFCLTKLSMM